MITCFECVNFEKSENDGGILLFVFLSVDNIWNFAGLQLRFDASKSNYDGFYSKICNSIDVIRTISSQVALCDSSNSSGTSIHPSWAKRLEDNLTVFILLGVFIKTDYDFQPIDSVTQELVNSALESPRKLVLEDLNEVLNNVHWAKILNLAEIYINGNLENSLYFISCLNQRPLSETYITVDESKQIADLWSVLIVIFTRFPKSNFNNILGAVLKIYFQPISITLNVFFTLIVKDLATQSISDEHRDILYRIVYVILERVSYESDFESHIYWISTFLVAFNVLNKEQSSCVIFQSARMLQVAKKSVIFYPIELVSSVFKLIATDKNSSKSQCVFGDLLSTESCPLLVMANRFRGDAHAAEIIAWAFPKLAYITACDVSKILSKLMLIFDSPRFCGDKLQFPVSVVAACCIELSFLQNPEHKVAEFTVELAGKCITQFLVPILQKTESLSRKICRYLSQSFPVLVVSFAVNSLHRILDKFGFSRESDVVKVFEGIFAEEDFLSLL